MTTNFELVELAKKLNISNFRGCIMRDEFNSLKPYLHNECGIYNFNDSTKTGSHWCSWFVRDGKFYHFCSYGSDPCKELKEYSHPEKIKSHTYRIQDWEDETCGEFCILFCYLMSKNLNYEDVVLFMTE